MNPLTLISWWFIPTFCLIFPLAFAYQQRRWPSIAEECYRMDFAFSLWMAVIAGISGPFGILICFVLFDRFKYGFLLPSWKRLLNKENP